MGSGERDHNNAVIRMHTPPIIDSALDDIGPAFRDDRTTDRTNPHGPAGLQITIVCNRRTFFFPQGHLSTSFIFQPQTITNPWKLSIGAVFQVY